MKRQLPDGRSAKRVDLLYREGQPLPENTKLLDYRRFRGKRQKGHVIGSPVSSGSGSTAYSKMSFTKPDAAL